MRIPYFSLVAAGALTLGGCAYGDLGHGVGASYGDPDYASNYNPYGAANWSGFDRSTTTTDLDRSRT